MVHTKVKADKLKESPHRQTARTSRTPAEHISHAHVEKKPVQPISPLRDKDGGSAATDAGEKKCRVRGTW